MDTSSLSSKYILLQELSIKKQILDNRDNMELPLSSDEMFIEISRHEYKQLIELSIQALRKEINEI